MGKNELKLALGKVFGDFILIWLAFICTYFLRQSEVFGFLELVDYSMYKSWDEFLNWSFRASLSFVIVFAFTGLYTLKRATFWYEIKKLFRASATWFALVVLFYFLQRAFPFSRFVIIFNVFLSFLFLGVYRYFLLKLKMYFLSKGNGVRRLVIVSNENSILSDVICDLENSLEYKVVGYFSGKQIKDFEFERLGSLSDLVVALSDIDFDEVMQVGVSDNDVLNKDILNYCRNNQKLYSYIPELFDIQRRNVFMHQVGDVPIFEMRNTKLSGWGRVGKRAFDLILSSIGIVILSPVFVLAALAIKIEDPKSGVLWLYLDDGKTVVKRVGYMKRLFYCFKFRTMKPNSHMMRYNELADKDIRGDELVKIGNDPRVTRVGRFLRRFDIDELPQLLNVFLGNMSLVGPRPHLPEEVANYKDHHQFVFNIKPGVTGLSQISGRSDLSFENEVKLDSYYIENWSLWLDLKIILKTVMVVFQGHGESNQKSDG